jgi:hypothetical protein
MRGLVARRRREGKVIWNVGAKELDGTISSARQAIASIAAGVRMAVSPFCQSNGWRTWRFQMMKRAVNPIRVHLAQKPSIEGSVTVHPTHCGANLRTEGTEGLEVMI